MTDNEMRIAIAQACPDIFGICEQSGDLVRWLDEEGIHCDDCDPLNDLNAMHEVEKTLDGDTGFNYDQEIWRHYGCRATARQRVKVFLKVKGLWRDTAQRDIPND